MEILSFQDAPSPKRKKSVRVLLGISVLLGVGVFGSTLAANISINSGSAFEFGQGVVQASPCDEDGIIVTPGSTFANAAGAGAFYFGTVSISGIDPLCDGKTFTIKAYDDVADSLALPLGNTESAISFAFSTGIPPDNDDGNRIVHFENTDEVLVTFVFPDSLASSVYKVTVETS